MAKCPNCNSANYVQRCMECLHSETPKVKQGVLPCEWPCTATVHVTESQTGRPIQGIYTRVDGASDQTDANGFRITERLKPGSHAAGIVIAALGDNYAFPIGQSTADVTKPIAAGENQFFSFVLDPLRPLKVIVRRRHDSKGVEKVKVELAAGKPNNALEKSEDTTPSSGEVLFKKLRSDTYRVSLELDADSQKKYELEKAEEHHTLDLTQNPNELVLWARLVVYLKLKYLCPDTKIRAFPKDFPVTVVFDDDTTKDLKILDDEGNLKFAIETDKKKNFTLKFDSTKARYLVHPTREVPDPTAVAPARTDLPKTKVFEDSTDDQLREWTTDGKKFFALPKTWSLVHSDWDVVDVVVKADGKIDINDGVGKSDKPAELTLKPKFQYARFEFHDRKYGAKGEAHDAKRVSIPAIVLKGCRESTDAGVPVNPIAGTHDAVSNWQIKPGEADKACQALPWIKVKDDAGTALPKFNNRMMLEWGWKDGFVQSTGKDSKDRKIINIPAADDRRKPNRDRPQYYDLPETWRSKWYYTRLSDENKNKFFDKFQAADDPDLEASLAEDTKLVFSLDDIVLTANDGRQETIQDKKNSDDSATPFSKYSRITILETNRENHPALNKKMFNVKVFDPQDDAKYWSKTAFAAEVADTGPWRNVIVKYPYNPRLVVFCSDFYDIYDKRTKPADCSGKKIMGARAAQREDTDISSKKVLMNQTGHADKAYVGYKGSRAPRWHYLHYLDVDNATTVYGALVVYWSATFEKSNEPPEPNVPPPGTHDVNGTDADVDLFRDKGLELAMKRWNDKDYYFEENDDKNELRIKTFALYEAKGVKISDGNFSNTGGKAICRVYVRDDDPNGGSWAMPDGSEMMMRKSGAKDEGDDWGDDPGTLPGITRWEGGNANPKCAFAHELGHSAFALHDLYLTTYGKMCQTGDKNKKLSRVLCCYENMYNDKKEGQEYLGMPYEMDGGGVMKSNRAETRLREAWLRANWLNDMAKPGGVDKLPDLLNKRRFRAAYEVAGKDKLKYHREDDDRHIYKPSKSGAGYALANHGKCDMHLYHLGDDEYARILKGGPFNGILVVSIKICVKFVEAMPWAQKAKYFVDDLITHDGKLKICKTEQTNKAFDANDWTEVTPFVNGTAYVAGNVVSQGGKLFKHDGVGVGNAALKCIHVPLTEKQKVARMETLNAGIIAALADDDRVGKFKVYGTGKFSNTLIRIFPQWSYETDPGGAHMTLTYSPLSKAFQPDGVNIRAGTGCEAATLIRYMLGKLGDDPTKWDAQGLTGDMARADFDMISDWMNNNAGASGFIVAANS